MAILLNLKSSRLAHTSTLILIIGIILRIHQYLMNRSLWLDEAFLALDIKNLGFRELLNPECYGQVAPIGFLLLEKLSATIFGVSELSLRLLPFLSSIIFIIIIYRFLKAISKSYYLLAFSLMCFSPTLIYYSSELKQYHFDLLSYVACFYIFFKVLSNENRNQII